ncbi:MAG: BcII family subclass B1 metallo-beta-lactamase [Balneolaceae bacterium]
MKSIAQIALVLLLLSGCKANKQILNNYESEALKVEQISDHIFKHTSFLETRSSGLVPSNGMIYINDNKAIIFDTPVDNKATAELIKWLDKIEIEAVIVTHFHIDCLGGLDIFHAHNIKSYATNKTIALAKEDNRTLPQNSFDSTLELNIGNEIVYAKYFGEGHTVDNIIGYVPTEKVLFGGCLVKQMNASKGSLSDANTKDWSETVERIKSELPEIEIVIPGHGKSGGVELLDYTIDLFQEN